MSARGSSIMTSKNSLFAKQPIALRPSIASVLPGGNPECINVYKAAK